MLAGEFNCADYRITKRRGVHLQHGGLSSAHRAVIRSILRSPGDPTVVFPFALVTVANMIISNVEKLSQAFSTQRYPNHSTTRPAMHDRFRGSMTRSARGQSVPLACQRCEKPEDGAARRLGYYDCKFKVRSCTLLRWAMLRSMLTRRMVCR